MLWGRVKSDLFAQAILERAKASGDKSLSNFNKMAPEVAR